MYMYKYVAVEVTKLQKYTSRTHSRTTAESLANY